MTLDFRHPGTITGASLIAVVLLAFLAYGTARVVTLDKPGMWFRKKITRFGWETVWRSRASDATLTEKPVNDDIGAWQEDFIDRHSKWVVFGWEMSSPVPPIVRFVYSGTDCMFCTGFHTSWIAWSLAFGFRPLTIAWWMGVFVVRGLQSAITHVE